MKKILPLALITAFLFQSCDPKTEKKTTEIAIATQKVVAEDRLPTSDDQKKLNAAEDELEKLPIRDFPIVDSSRFEFFDKTGTPDKTFLKDIQFKTKHQDAHNYRLNYRIPFSENFKAFVVTYQSGEHELITEIVTLTKENKMIDQLEIAYDEIAESAFFKSSKIDKNKIVVTSENWMSEENPIYESKTYVLQSNGKFKEI